MLCLTYFQESFYFCITIEKFSKSLFQTSAMRRVLSALINSFLQWQ